MLSVLIPTLNEAANIADCLASVRWVREIVVVDSGSADGTPQIATQLGAQVVQFNWNGRLPKKKNWALENIPWRNEWVLILDADERVTPALAAEITSALANPSADGYFLNRRFLFMGKWIRHCGYYPSWNLRLFRHVRGRYEIMCESETRSGDNEVHEHVILNGRSAFLHKDMLHLAYPDIFTWVEKHNRYSNWEAQLETCRKAPRSGVPAERHWEWFRGLPAPSRDAVTPRFIVPAFAQAEAFNDHSQIAPFLAHKRRLKLWSRRFPFRPTLRFLYSYILQRGFLDGYEGYALCRLLATYEMLSALKTRELRLKTTRRAAVRSADF
ncbi:MAG TPA: glycosyltransferase family 2 protein [Verrucomicrobiae bacterium]|nr:glycosyltransferase family 2 protein [Verrucomicrobiae bacterium]